ncbi:hypothetical protein HPP92_009891 [Vanilla planifolia]|uniref:Uncharacterized protein n=1 Tax=Vanilla planifolia TaxID=51239 RepID=A0A835V565_VANPL|nr:hypothetical protein HPP92_009891 [Vanilla planifolia]
MKKTNDVIGLGHLCIHGLSILSEHALGFQGTTDAVAIQFFLKNINPGMRNAARKLFGRTSSLQSRPNVFGELLKFMVTPTTAILEAVDWVLNGTDPDIALHMRMLTNRSVRAVKVAIKCIKMALHNYGLQIAKPRVVLVSDTPSFIKDISPNLTKFADVLYFDYEMFKGSISNFSMNMKKQSTDFRIKDWGPAPRWVAFVDFFLASRAKHAVISGANRRVGTTYAQLIAALAAANSHGDASKTTRFAFLSSFQSNLLVNGLAKQVGWGHIWNRFAGPLSCRSQPDQCAFTPLLPPAWWDGEWQSPIPRDIRRMQAYGVQVTEMGLVINSSLENHCTQRKDRIKIINVFPS